LAKYKIIIERPAENDLADILLYITKNLHAPDTAKRIHSSIKKSILSLDQNPRRYRLIEEEPYAYLGVRFMLTENYVVFYIVQNDSREIHVLRVLYKRRQWQDLI
jgi:plasmid stabilization system protein ParE